jgi:hypothetical protein
MKRQYQEQRASLPFVLDVQWLCCSASTIDAIKSKPLLAAYLM